MFFIFRKYFWSVFGINKADQEKYTVWSTRVQDARKSSLNLFAYYFIRNRLFCMMLM